MRLGFHHPDRRFFPIVGKRAVIGSGRSCEIRIDGDLAPAHARVRLTEVGICLEDLGAPAGTFVNGYRIGAHFLSRGDDVRFGALACSFELDPEGAVPGATCRRCGAELGGAPSAAPERCAHCAQLAGTAPDEAHPPPSSSGGEGSDEVSPWARMTMGHDVPRLAGYKVLGLIGEGSQARVYRMRETATGRVVAGKHLTTLSTRAIKRLLREADALRLLDHPGIVSLVGVHQTKPDVVLITELVDGPSLATLIKSSGPLAPRRALSIAASIADALAYASAKGAIHRDVKPSNVVIGPGDVAKLTDFGLVSLQDSGTKLTVDGAWIGTPQYMSPEQFDGKPVDDRADVWGLAVTFFEAIVGVAPFQAATTSQLYRLILEGAVDIDRLRACAGEDVASIFAAMLAKRPDDRPAAREVAVRLRSLARLRSD